MFALSIDERWGVAFAEQWVASGLVAVCIATIPLWTALWMGLWGSFPDKQQWIGMIIGLVGIGILNLEGDLRAHPIGSLVVLAGATSWAFGSVWRKRQAGPSGLMANAAEMLTGGGLLMLIGLLFEHQQLHLPILSAIAALLYLISFEGKIADVEKKAKSPQIDASPRLHV